MGQHFLRSSYFFVIIHKTNKMFIWTILICNTVIIHSVNEVRGVYRDDPVCPSDCLCVCLYTRLSVRPSVCLSVSPSVCLSVQISVRPISFFWFDMDMPYLAHTSISMRECVVNIYDPDSILTFDLKVILKGFCRVFASDPWLLFALTLTYHIWHSSITMRVCVAYIHEPDETLTFDLKVKFIAFLPWLCVWATAFCPLTWSYYFWHLSVLPLYDVSVAFMTFYDLDPWTQYQNFIFTMNLSLAGPLLLFKIWVYHHEPKFVLPWILTYMWGRGILSELNTQFLSC